MIDPTSRQVAEKLGGQECRGSIDQESYVEDHESRVLVGQILKVLATRELAKYQVSLTVSRRWRGLWRPSDWIIKCRNCSHSL